MIAVRLHLPHLGKRHSGLGHFPADLKDPKP
jgi:hypothetical protein